MKITRYIAALLAAVALAPVADLATADIAQATPQNTVITDPSPTPAAPAPTMGTGEDPFVLEGGLPYVWTPPGYGQAY
jgi:hypothetical protein